MSKLKFFFTSLLFLNISLCAKLPELTPEIVNTKINEIMHVHAHHKKLSLVLIPRILTNYLEMLDPTKTYFVEEDISTWIDPSDETANAYLTAFSKHDYSVFFVIQKKMQEAIEKRRIIEENINLDELPTKVSVREFKDLKWAKTDEELQTRLQRLRSLQLEAAAKLTDELKERSLKRIQKRQSKYEEEILNPDPGHQKNYVLSQTLKAMAGSLDSHTNYFTPEEATQFLFYVQQRLFGIGAQLRDDLNGLTIVKIVEGSPAYRSELLKLKDRIIAVNGEPVVGMDITDSVQLIRGEKDTPVVLTLVRETKEEDKDPVEETLDITIVRGEVVVTESRYETSYEPFGDGVIGYLHLHSFYQDPEHSSSSDLQSEIEKLKKEHNLKGIILDLRYNSGGLLTQAVSVTGLFITKGIVVSIMDDQAKVQHLRDLDGKVAWDGPLIVLTNRGSASASEIVAGTLKDYGRAIVVGDDHTYGKGSFQTFTLNGNTSTSVNSEGEYKVTRGRYYTVSGNTPQLEGIPSDIIVPGPLSESDIGEKFTKYPLEHHKIKPNFEDDLADIPATQRQRVKMLYHFNLQPKLDLYNAFLDKLKTNSQFRIEKNSNYQAFLREIGKKDDVMEDEDKEEFGQNDLQLHEGYNIMKDLILLQGA